MKKISMKYLKIISIQHERGTKKYLLWGRHTSGLNKSKYVEGANKSEKKFFSEDLEEREGWKYNLWFVRSYLQGSIHSSQNKRFFEISIGRIYSTSKVENIDL